MRWRSAPTRILLPISANAQPAVAYWALNDETGRQEAMAIDVLTLEGDRVKEITAYISPASSRVSVFRGAARLRQPVAHVAILRGHSRTLAQRTFHP